MGRIIQLHQDKPQQPKIQPEACVLIADARKDDRVCVFCQDDDTYLAIVNPAQESMSLPMCKPCFDTQLDGLRRRIEEMIEAGGSNVDPP